MDENYTKKENARMALTAALEAYKNAAEAFGADEQEMADEIDTCLADAGLVNEAGNHFELMPV